MNQNPSQPKPPIEELEIVMSDTNALSVQEQPRVELVAKLKPIADKIATYTNYAASLTVITEEDAKAAATQRDLISADAATAEQLLREFDGKLVDRLFRAHRAWTSLIGVISNPLNNAARQVKQKIISWQQAEEEKAERERQRLQAEADEKARKERERLEKQAQKLKTPELKEQRLEQAAQIVAPVVQVAAPKAAVKVQKRWKVTAIDKSKFLAAAATDRNLHGFVDLNEGALSRSKAANSTLEIAGITFTHVTV